MSEGAVSRDYARRLLDAIRAVPPRPGRIEEESARRDWSLALLGIFLLGFLYDALAFGRRRRLADYRFDVGRIGTPPEPPHPLAAAVRRATGGRAVATLLVLLAAGCGGPWLRTSLWRSHQENERGLARDLVGRHDAARSYYERSIGYRVRAPRSRPTTSPAR